MRSIAEWLEHLAVNAKVATVLGGSIPASSDTVESEGRQKNPAKKIVIQINVSLASCKSLLPQLLYMCKSIIRNESAVCCGGSALPDTGQL
jgi:hypothetical protein